MDIALPILGELTDDHKQILEYMGKYPTFYFRSTRLAKVFGVSPNRLSKMLLEMHKAGILEKYVRSRRHPYSYYRLK